MSKQLLILLLLALLAYSQYTVVSKNQGTSSVKLTLKYTGQHQYYVKPKSKVVKELVFLFRALTYSDFTFKIYDPNQARFEVPQGGIFPADPQANFSFPLSSASYKLNYTSQHFSFMVVRRENDAVLFDSSVVEIEFSDYYIQIGTITDSKLLFGFSERFTDHFSLQPGTWTVWNKDNGQKLDVGATNTGGIQTHGYYPLYLTRQRSGNHHIGYFRTSDAMDVEVESYSNTSYLKIYRTIGGIIDFRFWVGERDPEVLIEDFHSYIGPAHIPPFWSLGYHQSRWGYHNVSALETVIEKYHENSIPLDIIWSDIDYMHDFQTFTVDTDNFPLDRMKAITKKYKYVPIVEPSIRNRQGYAYDQGKKRNVYIKSAEGEDQLGKVWAGLTDFVDYFHPNSTQYWKDMLEHLHQQVDFSGCWLDMNEISNLCDGPCETPKGPTVIDYTHDIPYHPGGKNIEMVNIPLNATHYGNLLEAHTHVFFGMMQSHATFEYLKTKGRPFILSRSHTLGSNRYAAHWTGDNFSNFTFLRLSIAGTFMQNMMGMQMVGSDICGFGGNVTEELCSRFYQLGSVYPFARNHNQDNAIDQEAYALGPVVMAAAKNNLKLRYSILKAYYRQFVTRKGTGTIFRPLFFEFYQDQKLLEKDILQTQIILGGGMMITPIVEKGINTRSVYFPTENWFNYHTGEQYKANSTAEITCNLTDLVPMFMRSGIMVPRNDATKVTRLSQLNNSFELVIALKLVEKTTARYYYKAQGGLLALNDYDNNEDVTACINQGCDYALSASYSYDSTTQEKILQINIKYIGGGSVRYEQSISDIYLYIEGRQKRWFMPDPPLRILEDRTVTYRVHDEEVRIVQLSDE